MTRLRQKSLKSHGMTALILGFFAFAWFGWGQASASSTLSVGLGVGSVLGILIATAGGVVTLRSSGSSTRMADPAVRHRYYVVVGSEFAILIAGAIWLNTNGHSAYTPAWVCAGVGLHFLPLAQVLDDRSLVPLGMLIMAAAAAAVIVYLAANVAPSTVTGIGAGALLAVFGLLNLARAAGSSRRSARHPGPVV